jgi:hypothetical protein
VTDDDYHEGQLEHVDPQTNEIYLTTKRARLSQCVRFKREFHEAAEGEHGAANILVCGAFRNEPLTLVFLRRLDRSDVLEAGSVLRCGEVTFALSLLPDDTHANNHTHTHKTRAD